MKGGIRDHERASGNEISRTIDDNVAGVAGFQSGHGRRNNSRVSLYLRPCSQCRLPTFRQGRRCFQARNASAVLAEYGSGAADGNVAAAGRSSLDAVHAETGRNAKYANA